MDRHLYPSPPAHLRHLHVPAPRGMPLPFVLLIRGACAPSTDATRGPAARTMKPGGAPRLSPHPWSCRGQTPGVTLGKCSPSRRSDAQRSAGEGSPVTQILIIDGTQLGDGPVRARWSKTQACAASPVQRRKRCSDQRKGTWLPAGLCWSSQWAIRSCMGSSHPMATPRCRAGRGRAPGAWWLSAPHPCP